jgi:dihydrofolate reductase
MSYDIKYYDELNMIVAHERNLGIGYNGHIPWYISEDLRYFRNLTKDSIIVMGRTTYDSIPSNRKPLKDRINIVLTTTPDKYRSYDNLVYTNEYQLYNWINHFSKNTDYKKVFIIGGQEIYKKWINKVDNLYVTYIDKNYNCNVFFPNYKEHFILNNVIKEDYSEQEGCYIKYTHFIPKT